MEGPLAVGVDMGLLREADERPHRYHLDPLQPSHRPGSLDAESAGTGPSLAQALLRPQGKQESPPRWRWGATGPCPYLESMMLSNQVQSGEIPHRGSCRAWPVSSEAAGETEKSLLFLLENLELVPVTEKNLASHTYSMLSSLEEGITVSLS